MDHTSKPSFTPISPNPFIVGNPVRDRKMFFGREVEFELVRKRFTDTEAKGGLIVFCGERRSGKTSILFQILDGRLGGDFIPVLIDMQSMAIENELDFLEKIAREIAQELGGGQKPPANLISGSNPVSAFHKFVASVLKEHPHRKLILLFDEYELFENKIESGVLSEDALYILSNLMENQSVFVIFTGSLSLENRRRDYWKIFLGKSIYRQISYLEAADARRLVTEPVQGKVEYEPGVVEAIYRLTSGQAFYTQAVCQNLVDLMNEKHTYTATMEMLEEVVTGIVANPFPQMIFLWEGLDDREKLVMALAAEALEDDRTFAGAQTLLKRISTSRYPLDLDLAAVSTSLEKLFKQEMLLKDSSHPPGYAYRMDLWRRWVRRMHSVWQAMREIGMDIRPARRSRLPLLIGGAAAAAVLAGAAGYSLFGRSGKEADRIPAVYLAIDVIPEGKASIYQNDLPAGFGRYEGLTAVGSHVYRLTAPGYADTTFDLTLSADSDTVRKEFALRPLLGGARVSATPPDAEILVDEISRGPGPATVTGLPVPEPHTAQARMAGFLPGPPRSFRVVADTTIPVELPPLEPIVASVSVSSTPPGASITADGDLVGFAPMPVPVAPGSHRFRLELENYLTVDTTLVVGQDGDRLRVNLREKPPGFLELRGDSLALMQVDNNVIAGSYTRNSGKSVKAGWHRIRVQLRSGREVPDSVLVAPGEHVVYDYIERRVTERKRIGSGP